MYFVYVDEAGTSAKEPVTVVVGIIVHADRSWRQAAILVERTLDRFVPPSLRQGFIFHAKAVWGGDKELRRQWMIADRISLIGAMAAIPRQLNLAISLGRVRRDWDFPVEDFLPSRSMPRHQFHHIAAFRGCFSRANKHIHDWGQPHEVATVVAEDAPDMRRFLKHIVADKEVFFRLPVTPEYIRLTKAERHLGLMTQTRAGKIDRIIDTVHFAQKTEAPLLQIADACAFVFRRYFSRQDHGEWWVNEMLGGVLTWEDWQGPISEFVFSFDPAHRLRMTASFRHHGLGYEQSEAITPVDGSS